MPIIIARDSTNAPVVPPYAGGGSDGGTDYTEYGDACSILVPVDIIGNGAFVQMRANGIPLPEDNSPVWDGARTYVEGDRVHLPGTHRVYESAKAGNVGKDPSQIINQFNAAGQATWWIDLGTTNKYAMFDGLVSTPTVAPSPLEITLMPGAFNGFALFGIDADSYSVDIADGDTGIIYYSEPNTALDSASIDDYYEYFFAQPKPQRQLIRTGIEPYDTARIKLTFYKATGDAIIGMLALGDLRPVGIPQRDAQVTIQDFSYFKRDAFGNVKLTKRRNGTDMKITTMMDNDDANSVLDTIRDVQGTPAVIIGSQGPGYEYITTYGKVTGSMSPVEYPFATLTISVEGFI